MEKIFENVQLSVRHFRIFLFWVIQTFQLVLIMIFSVNFTVILMSLSAADASLLTSLVAVLAWSAISVRATEILILSISSKSWLLQFTMAEMSASKILLSEILELLSLGFRTVSLGFRLLANISAGHVITDLANSVKFVLSGPASLSADALLVVRILALQIYETGVSSIQICVYWALLLVYVG